MATILFFLMTFLPVLYTFARDYVHNEPLKSKTDGLFDKVNSLLNELKSGNQSELILKVKKRSKQLVVISLLLLLITIFLPVGKLTLNLFLYFGLSLITSTLVYSSIHWTREHGKTLKELIRNPLIICLLCFPLLWYFFSDLMIHYSKNRPDTEIIKSTFSFVLSFTIFQLAAFQLVWSTVIIGFLYASFSVILFPIYCCIHASLSLLNSLEAWKNI